MKKFAKNISVYLILFLVVLMVAMFYKGLDSDQKTVTEVSFSKFAQMVEQEKFEAVQIENTTLTGQINKETYYYAYAPSVLEIQLVGGNLSIRSDAEGYAERILQSKAGYRIFPLESAAEPADDRCAGLPVLHYDESGRQWQGVPVRQVARQDGQGRRKESDV